jgi:VanZ family protein
MVKYKRMMSFFPVIFLSGLIVYLSNQSSIPEIDIPILSWDKIQHITAFFIYGLSVILAFHNGIQIKSHRKIVLYTIIYGAIFAMSDEIHQYFIAGRDADVFDWIADLIGILLSIYLLNKSYIILKNKKIKSVSTNL